MDYQKIGNRIKLLRKEIGLTQEKLSELADISPGFMSAIESGRKPGHLILIYALQKH